MCRLSVIIHVVCHVTLLLQLVSTFKMFQQRIPNGHRVPNPCRPGELWGGVGHRIPGGMGTRNPFGEDFDKQGKKWTNELCQMDSDGDGRTNGQELGDPGCVWTKGQEHPQHKDITHPGVCDPWDSVKCQARNGWLKCAGDGLNCPIIEHRDTLHEIYRFPRTEIPATHTNYFCQLFDLPEGDFHLVATEPVIDNTDIVHHILLFGCQPTVKIESTPEPYRCQMLAHPRCLDIIGTWTVGSHGDCLQDGVGFRIGGDHGYKTAALQIHWNNPSKTPNTTDSSGLKVHFVKTPRKHDAGSLLVGQEFLEIGTEGDGQLDEYKTITYSQLCPSRCTEEMFPTSIYITTAINHMHYQGLSQRIELFRNGTKVRDITYDRYYHYDSPVIYLFDPPVEIKPGDEIITTCVFKTKDGGNPICFGDGTQDEMCYGFITYYPKQELRIPWCTSRKGVHKCDRYLPKFADKPLDGCLWRTFPQRENNTRQMFQAVIANCFDSKKGVYTCTENCSVAIATARKHPCLSGDIGSYVVSRLMRSAGGFHFLDLLFTCDCDQQFENTFCEKRYTKGILGEEAPKMCAGRDTPSSSSNLRSSLLIFMSNFITVTFIVTCIR